MSRPGLERCPVGGVRGRVSAEAVLRAAGAEEGACDCFSPLFLARVEGHGVAEMHARGLTRALPLNLLSSHKSLVSTIVELPCGCVYSSNDA